MIRDGMIVQEFCDPKTANGCLVIGKHVNTLDFTVRYDGTECLFIIVARANKCRINVPSLFANE